MFKKVVSIVIICLMMVTTLTACGVNDLGYLNLSRKQSKITEYSFNNKTNLEIAKTDMWEKYTVDFQIDGEANLTDLDSMYMSVDLLLKVNDIEVKNPINFKLIDNKIYVRKDVLLEIIKLSKIMEEETKGLDKIIQSLYDNELKDFEYILLSDLGEVYSNTNSQEITEIVMKYLEAAFKGFDSKIIKKTSKGYQIELSSENILAFLTNISEYLSKNKELVFNETIIYMENLMKVMDLSSIYFENNEDEELSEDEINALKKEYSDEVINELKESKQDFFDAVDEFAEMLKQDEIKNYIEMIKGSKYTGELTESGNTYGGISNIVAFFKGEEMGKSIANTTITPRKVNKVNITGKSITLEDLQEIYTVVENKVNPVKVIEVSWYDDDYYADINSMRLEGNSSYDFKEFVIKEGRIYLPLRYICETFGETVEWDSVNRKAYIIRGNEKTDMTGIIQDGSTMVKVRDFEKLGYTVDFEKTDDLSLATITKN